MQNQHCSRFVVNYLLAFVLVDEEYVTYQLIINEKYDLTANYYLTRSTRQDFI